MFMKYAMYGASALLLFIIVISLGASLYGLMTTQPEPSDNSGEIGSPDFPEISFQLQNAVTNQPTDASVMVWEADESNYERFIGRFETGDRLDSLYQGNHISVVEDSDQYYSSQTGSYRRTIDLPAEKIQVNQGDSRLLYNLLKVSPKENMSITARTPQGDELESGEENEPENYEIEVAEDSTKNFQIDLQQEANGHYQSGILFIKSLNNIENVNVTSIISPQGNSIDFETETIKNSQTINIGNSTVQGWDKAITWDNEILASETLSVKLKAQSQNLPTEVDNTTMDYKMDGAILQFRDYDHSSNISGPTFGYEAGGEDLGYSENLTHPNNKNTGVLIEAK